MTAFEINTELLSDQFYELPHKLYDGNKNWSIQLGSDLDQVFNEKKNSLFQHGELKRWIVLDEWNNFAGRIAAFYSHRQEIVKGGFGFFECTENFAVAESLLHTAASWLKSKGCMQMEGPVNFGEKDRYWGLLTWGFDDPCLYLENYNPAYYEVFFDRYGLKPKDTINTYRVELEQVPYSRLSSIAKRLKEKHDISFEKFCSDNTDKFARDIFDVYIHSFTDTTRFHMITVDDIKRLIEMSKPVLSDDLIWLAYQNDIPIGLLAFMKDLNQVIKGIKQETNLKGFAISITPEHRKKGIELALASALYEALAEHSNTYTLYFTGVNRKTIPMVSFMKKLNADLCKTHMTYELNF